MISFNWQTFMFGWFALSSLLCCLTRMCCLPMDCTIDCGKCDGQDVIFWLLPSIWLWHDASFGSQSVIGTTPCDWNIQLFMESKCIRSRFEFFSADQNLSNISNKGENCGAFWHLEWNYCVTTPGVCNYILLKLLDHYRGMVFFFLLRVSYK